MTESFLSTEVQLRLLAAEVSVLILILLVVFGHALWVRWRESREEPLVSHAHDKLISALSQQHQGDIALDSDLRQSLARLVSDQQVALFAGLASNLDGDQRSSLTRIADDLGLITQAERDCHSRLWWRRLYACRLLTLVGGGENAVPELLNDRQPEIRAQAAEWAASHPNPAIIEALLRQLAIPSNLCRFSVQDSLLRIGSPAIDSLASYLAEHHGSAAEAALEVAIGLPDPRLLAPALSLCHDAERRVRALAASVAGAIGGNETITVLRDLLEDPASNVRAAAAEALGRLGDVRSGSLVALKLRDQAWEVRRAAGLALRDFGAPGILYLRRALNDSDPFAADMARQLLDLSAVVGDAV